MCCATFAQYEEPNKHIICCRKRIGITLWCSEIFFTYKEQQPIFTQLSDATCVELVHVSQPIEMCRYILALHNHNAREDIILKRERKEIHPSQV